MLLLDTSVWIDLLRGRDTSAVRYALQREDQEDLALTPMSYLEVLQGARSRKEQEQLQDLLRGYVLLEPHELGTYEAAAQLYMKARQEGGFTVRTAVDCLIAATAIERELILLHNDRDFISLAKVEPRLVLYPSVTHH